MKAHLLFDEVQILQGDGEPVGSVARTDVGGEQASNELEKTAVHLHGIVMRPVKGLRHEWLSARDCVHWRARISKAS